MSELVLFVDDEESILHAIRRLFDESPFALRTAGSGEDALEILKREKVAVVVSDHLMPGMNGVELLARAAMAAPETVRVLMTAYADLNTAINAINQCEIFRFLTKPWENERLQQVVTEALDRHRLVRTLRSGEEATLLSLAQTIELKDHYTKGHCERVARHALQIAGRLDLDPRAMKEIEFGGWLHDCGKIGVPERILNFPGPLSEEEFSVIRNHPVWGGEVARQARLPRRVINIILHHHEHYDGQGYPAGLEGESIPLEARIIAVADVFDALTTDRPYRPAMAREKAILLLEQMRGGTLDPQLVDIFVALQQSGDGETAGTWKSHCQ